MNSVYKKLSSFVFFIALLYIVISGTLHAQIVTNGSFEDTNAGTITGTDAKGWLIQVADGITPAPVFEIVGDTVQQGSKALKVTIDGLGTNQWDIQIVADSLHVTNGATYNFSVWAKAQNAGAQVNFTVGNYSYSEYGAIRPASLTTEWKKFTMQFTVNDNQTVIRAPIHFSYAGNVGNIIQISDVNAGKKPVVVEAESGVLGSKFVVMQDGSVNYITTTENNTSLTSPGDTSRMATYQVTFADSGWYNLFVRLNVGADNFNDDSFFYGRGFGTKSDTASADWVFINGLAGAGFADSTDYVDGPGTLGSSVWKWVNVSKNTYQSGIGDSFYVSPDSLTKTFQIGSREDGLLIDKIAFGKTNLYYTVKELDQGLPGDSEMGGTVDTGTVWTGPALATGDDKFLGSAYAGNDANFTNYWNQLTPENAGKWGSVGTSSDTTKWNWSGLDAAYNFAIDNHISFKDHCLIWGQQQPSWISSLDSAQQYSYIDYWIRTVGKRYPQMDYIDVVNEALLGHNPPDGGNGRANYKNALGGNGATGWDWVIKAFELARKYMPSNTKLILNDYGIINSNDATTSYLYVINLLKDRGLIDGIGVQGHRFEFESANTNTLKSNLDRLWATHIPIYITEFDLGNLSNSGTPNDAQQLQLYQKVFPILWEHPGVKGITFWGYLEGRIWQSTCYLVRSTGSARPALLWMAQYVKDHPTDVKENVSSLPSDFMLEQNFPNPFNPTTNIRYNVTKTTKVTLKVYDMLGREVQTLVNTFQSPGQYTVTFNGQGLASGVYFYRINAGDFSATKKLMLLK